MADLAAMPLYATSARFRNELAALGSPDRLTPEQLYPFDQIHYLGTDAVRHAAAVLALTPRDRVLDIGSGIGGPARYLAHTTGCHVTAIEIQEQMHAVAQDLTRRCGLATQIDHVRADAAEAPLAPGTFAAAVSWLALHHAADRPRVLRKVAAALRPGGRFYIEDLVERAPFRPQDLPDVAQTLYGVTMTSADEYARELQDAGFADVEVTDMTDTWRAFCASRAASWTAARDRHVRVHGEEIVAALDQFFTTVVRLFESGSLGVRLVGTLGG